jgi:C-terminal processing protease CtpA/Prc
MALLLIAGVCMKGEAAVFAPAELQGDEKEDPAKVREQIRKKIEEALDRLPRGASDDEIRQTIQRILDEVRRRGGDRRPDFRRPGEGDFAQRPPFGRPSTPSRGRLGIYVSPPSRSLAEQLDLGRDKGLVVDEVRRDSVAEKAGIKVNDVLLEVDGKSVPSDDREFGRILDGIKADQSFGIVVLRKGKKETIKGVKLAASDERPARPERPEQPRGSDNRLGIRVERPDKSLIDQLGLPSNIGLVIQDVAEDSPAGKAGFKPNDILLRIDGKDVSSDRGEFAKLLSEIKPDTSFNAEILRKGKKETIKDIKLGEAKEPERRPDERGGRPPFGGGFFPPWGRMGEGGINTTIFQDDKRLYARQQEGSTAVSVRGEIAEGKVKVSEISVSEGRDSNRYESIDKVPEKHRDTVRRLIEFAERAGKK